MFSAMIQNLLSSSGQASAMQRASQMNNYVNSLNAQWFPVENATQTVNANTKVESFDTILKSSAKTKFGDLLTNPSTRVNASLYSNQAASVKNDYSTKSKIKEFNF